MSQLTENRGEVGGRSVFKRLFISPHEGRLRAGWRILIHGFLILTLLSVPSLLLGIVYIVTQGSIDQDTLNQLNLVFNFLILGPSVVLATWIARRFLDRRSFVSLGFTRDKHALPDFLVGLALPAGIMGSIFLLEWALGWLSIEGFAWENANLGEILGPLALLLVAFVAVGFYEEILFRGYYMQNLLESLGRPLALFLTSAAFGVVHLSNPNSNLLGVLGITAAGYFLGFSWLRSRALWLPIGLHIGWNIFEGPVFGLPVSGISAFSLIRVEVHGPEVFTGGAFGPEGGLLLLPMLAIASAILWRYTRDRKK